MSSHQQQRKVGSRDRETRTPNPIVSSRLAILPHYKYIREGLTSDSLQETVVFCALTTMAVLVVYSLPWYPMWGFQDPGTQRMSLHDSYDEVFESKFDVVRAIHRPGAKKIKDSQTVHRRDVCDIVTADSGLEHSDRVEENCGYSFSLKTHFPGLKSTFDVARSSSTGSFFVTGVTTSHRVLVRLNSDLTPDVMIKLDSRTESHAYVTVGDGGEIYISSPADRAGIVKILDENGVRIGQMKSGTATTGILSSRDGKMYLCQPVEKRIVVLDPDSGKELLIFGEAYLQCPQFIAENLDHIYVSDFYAKSVFVFDRKGVLHNRIMHAFRGVEIVPRGIVVDENRKLLLVADKGNGFVHAFDQNEGKWLWARRHCETRSWQPAGLEGLPSGAVIALSEYEDNSHVLPLTRHYRFPS